LRRGGLAGGPHPERAGGLAAIIGDLRSEGIGAVLSVYEQPLEATEVARYRLSYLWQPTQNFEAPPDLAAACEFIDEARAAGVATLVHCWAGWGRTGTVLAAYLLHIGAADDAEAAVREVRERYDSNAVESPLQLRAVTEFARVRRG
jgi:atypical dual specificity phosphatase